MLWPIPVHSVLPEQRLKRKYIGINKTDGRWHSMEIYKAYASQLVCFLVINDMNILLISTDA